MTAAAFPTTPPTELSVVVPVYGCVGCLEELADQVQAAVEGMGVPFEMILVDDASPDGAWRRIEARRAFMDSELDIHLAPEVLPLSDIPAYLPPFLLRPDHVLTLV